MALSLFRTLSDKVEHDYHRFGTIKIQDFLENKEVKTHHFDGYKEHQLLFLCAEAEFL